MGIGLAIFLLAIGAILAFAVQFDVAGLDVSLVGWILMVVGGIGLIVVVTVWGPRRRAADRVTEERRVYRDEPPGL